MENDEADGVCPRGSAHGFRFKVLFMKSFRGTTMEIKILKTTITKILIALAFVSFSWTGLSWREPDEILQEHLRKMEEDLRKMDTQTLIKMQCDREFEKLAKSQKQIEKIFRHIQIACVVLTGMIVCFIQLQNKKRQRQQKKKEEDVGESSAG